MSLLKITEQTGMVSVRLSRPDVRNAFNPDMIAEITQAFTEFGKRRDLRVITLSGEGKAFCAGADLSWMKTMVNYSYEQNREDSLKLHAMFDAIAKCTVPVLGFAHGAVFGGALGLLACCDHVVAEEETQFCFSEVKIGIAPAVISSFVMAKAVPGVVRPLMISGEVFGTERALQSALIHEVVPKGEGVSRLDRVVTSWMEAGPEAARETKRLLNDLPVLSADQQKERTTKLIAERRVSTEGQEGLKSFLEKRRPSWRDQ
ncbi:MAG: enoyl-CoA hydratase/isomerase family protein [Bdellovibrionaceae bacterium]|nr:enoyl-CoA hydratase/isomerase family protein [Pseudobdellovibrionaceae bacterium]